MRKLLFIASLLFCSCASAGTKLLAPTNAPNSSSLPATCAKGDIYLYTGATSGQQWYACESANTWVQEGGSGGGNFINNQPTLQSGSTGYPDFLYVGSSETVYGPLTVTNNASGTWIQTTAGSNFGPKGGLTQVHSVDAFGSGGTYRIAVSSQSTLPTTHQPGQTEVLIKSPANSTDGEVDFWANGSNVANFTQAEMQAGTDVTIINNKKLKLFNGGQYVTFQSTAAPNQLYDINYTLPSSTGSVGQVLGINTIYSDHVDLDWRSGSAGGVSGSTGTIGIAIDGGGSAIVAGSTRSVTIPFACSFSSWTFTAGDSAGSISIHVSSSSIADYRSGIRSTISGSSPMSITSSIYNNGTMAGWSQTTFQAGDVISFVNDSASTLTWLTGIIWVIKS